MKAMSFVTSCLLACALVWLPAIGQAAPAGTAFSYQGQLKQGGAPVTDLCDFEFRLWPDPNDTDPNSQVGPTLAFDGAGGHPAPLQVTGGLFEVVLDFGGDVFTGDARWLEIAARVPHDPNGGSSFTTLAPRQELTPAPYALYALHSPGGAWEKSDSDLYYAAGYVGVGEEYPWAPLTVVSQGDVEAVAVENWGDSTSATLAGTNTGVRGSTVDPDGAGVYGLNFSYGPGICAAIYGYTPNPDGYAGVFDGRAYFMDDVGMGRIPSAKLDVAGTVRMDGFQLTSAPVAGYVLTADGTGIGTWQPGGGGGIWTSDAEGINYQSGNVGVGTATHANYRLFALSTGERTVFAHNADTSAQSTALYGEADSTFGRGVYGENTATSGTTYGVYGRSRSPTGRGTCGYASASTGQAIGVMGETLSPDGYGVWGYNDDDTELGEAIGVYGSTNSPSGTGVKGHTYAANGYGVYGINEATTGDAVGGYFKTSSTQGFGVRAEAVSAVSGYAGYFVGRGYFSNNVGIGTASPDSPLTVAGIVESLTGGFKFPDGTIQTTAGGGASLWQLNGSEIYYNAGNVGVGVSDPGTTLHIAGGNWDLVGTEGDFKIGDSVYRLKMGVATGGGGAGACRIYAGGPSSKLILGANGQERINITSSLVDVTGSLETDGFKLTDSPTSGYVLTCDASGNGTWQAPTGGGGFTLPYDGFVTSSSTAFSILNLGTGVGIAGWSNGSGGGSFRSGMTDGYGVKGEAVATSGSDSVGGWFESSSSTGKGVYSLATGYYASGIKAEATGTEATALSAYATGSAAVAINAKNESVSQPAILAKNYVGGPLIEARNAASNTVFEVANNGTTSVNVLHIMGGADLAEKFDVSGPAEPGTVVEIDPDHPGKLRVARGAYNRRVAGVISGANELGVGMVLADLPGAENAMPVALSGRVWVRCDATQHAVEPGDMLTTADRAGHAMAVTDFDRANGTVIGKAMSRLAKGETDMVLVLVNLQ